MAAQAELHPAADRETDLPFLVAELDAGDDGEPAAGAAQDQLIGAGETIPMQSPGLSARGFTNLMRPLKHGRRDCARHYPAGGPRPG